MPSSELEERSIPRKAVPNEHTNLQPADESTHTQRSSQILGATTLASGNDEQYTGHEHLPEERNTDLDDGIEESEPLHQRDASAPNQIIQTTSVHSSKTSTARKTPSTNVFKAWGAPITMIASLIAGLLLAIAHHEMNSNLHGQAVYSSGILTQQWTSLYSIALAFLVRRFFFTCVGVAFVQRLWLNFSTHHQPVRVKDFDTVTNATNDVSSLFSSVVWIKNPLLLIMASITWLIPLPAIFTPGTLSVVSQPFVAIHNEQVPQLSFNSTSYAVFHPTGSYLLLSENKELTKAALATATSTRILAMLPNHANQTYALSFFGPALKCQNANESQTLAASNGSYRILWEAYTGMPPWDSDLSIYSWDSLDVSDIPLDSLNATNDKKGNSIWVMSALGTFNAEYGGPGEGFGQVNLTECRLQNASYRVNFTFINSTQFIAVDEVVYMNPSYLVDFDPSLSSFNSETAPFQDWSDTNDIIVSYKAILSAFGNLLVGYVETSIWGSSKSGTTHYDLLNIDFTRSETTAYGLEYLFQNITFSLFSAALFLNNETDPVPVTVTTWLAAYKYDSRNLLIAYGAAFLVSLICCLIGLHACLINKDSYRNVFSTHVRAAYQSNLDVSMLTEQHDESAGPAPTTAFEQKIMIIGIHDQDQE